MIQGYYFLLVTIWHIGWKQSTFFPLHHSGNPTKHGKIYGDRKLITYKNTESLPLCVHGQRKTQSLILGHNIGSKLTIGNNDHIVPHNLWEQDVWSVQSVNLCSKLVHRTEKKIPNPYLPFYVQKLYEMNAITNWLYTHTYVPYTCECSVKLHDIFLNPNVTWKKKREKKRDYCLSFSPR